MVKQCIVHIGMHKTGSTSIQDTLFRNPSLRGGSYIDMGRANASVPLQSVLVENPSQVSQLKRRAATQEESHAFAQTAQAQLDAGLSQQAERVILSGEGLSTLDVGQIRNLHTFLTKHERMPQIVAYVRSAKGYMESVLQQRAKTGMSGLKLQGLMPKYRQRLEPFDLTFGTPQVALWYFQPNTFPEKCVVRDFCARLGLELDPTTIQRSNDGLSRNAVAMLMLYWREVGNGPGVTATRSARKLVQTMSQVPGPKCRLSPEVLAPVFATNQRQLDWIAERTRLNMADLGNSQPDDIRTEDDLLTLDAQALDWLQTQLDEPISASASSQELGAAIQRLAEKLVGEVKTAKRQARTSVA